jgi:opacity protein-like surface antigen
MTFRSKTSLFILFVLVSAPAWSQDLDKMLEEATGSSTQYTTATFKSTRIINGHSIERMPGGQLDVRISHRFGPVNSGAYNLWGLDQANMHLGFEYGITDWMMAGLGRGTYEKAYDGFLKFSLFRQSKGEKNMPVSMSLFTSVAYATVKLNLPGDVSPWDRMSYVAQFLVARKFNERFSFEINPTYIHRNMVTEEVDPNDTWAAGAGLRFKITKRMSFNAEYYYVIPPIHDFRSVKTYNPLAIGIDIETGGHVFCIMFTNSLAMIEKGFIGETTDQWKGAGIRLGFNLSRVFTLK